MFALGFGGGTLGSFKDMGGGQNDKRALGEIEGEERPGDIRRLLPCPNRRSRYWPSASRLHVERGGLAGGCSAPLRPPRVSVPIDSDIRERTAQGENPADIAVRFASGSPGSSSRLCSKAILTRPVPLGGR